jgi:hypothetical protein
MDVGNEWLDYTDLYDIFGGGARPEKLQEALNMINEKKSGGHGGLIAMLVLGIICSL